MKFPRLVLAICCATVLIAQTGRDAYRQAYDFWQQAEANLERDAGTGGAPQVAQADRSAAAVTTFEATRAAYLKTAAEDAAQRRRILQTPPTRSAPDLMPPAVATLAAAELQTVSKAIDKFAADQDRGIQQLRQSMEREKVALVALNETIRARQKTVAATSEAVVALEQARIKAAGAFDDQTAQLTQTLAQVDMEGAVWADYYDKLAAAIQIPNAPLPISTSAPRTETILGVPLVRYIGDWIYPAVNGVFHGQQPLSVELEVHEKNRHVDGILLARFKVAPGNPADATMSITFQGDLTSTPTQKFATRTGDGMPGMIELIPGPAFNLLEVNFQSDPQTTQVRSGNFILVKK